MKTKLENILREIVYIFVIHSGLLQFAMFVFDVNNHEFTENKVLINYQWKLVVNLCLIVWFWKYLY